MLTCHLAQTGVTDACVLKKSKCPIRMARLLSESISIPSGPASFFFFLSFLEYHLKGRHEPDLNSSFNMTCPFEIVQITMSDCHVEL